MTTSQRERTRKEETGERRRKRGGGHVHGRRLGVNPDLLDFTRFVYRWINDDPARLVAKTRHDDWDVMSNDGGAMKEDATDLGDAVSIVVGTNPDGSVKRAYLCRKPKTYFDEDQREKQAALDEQLNQLRRGNDRSGAAQGDYIPSSGISL